MGLVFVLLLGEIDLAAGTAAGVCRRGHGPPVDRLRLPDRRRRSAPRSSTGIVIGVGTGWLCAKIRIPSFVVTLALFLAFQGVVLYIVNNGKGHARAT